MISMVLFGQCFPGHFNQEHAGNSAIPFAVLTGEANDLRIAFPGLGNGLQALSCCCAEWKFH